MPIGCSAPCSKRPAAIQAISSVRSDVLTVLVDRSSPQYGLMMSRLTLDFETASDCDLSKAGAWAYAEHPTTEILCAAWITDFGYGWTWIPGQDEPLIDLRAYAEMPEFIFEAHNAAFEQAIWHYIMVGQLDMPPIPIERWDCTMARCLYNGLPAKLDTAAQVLGLQQQKDMEGSKLTRSLSKPMSTKTWMARMFP